MRGSKPVVAPLGDVMDLPTAMSVPDAPDYFGELARKCWDEVAGALIARHIYDEDIRPMVIAYCVQYARFLEADQKVVAEGMLLKRTRGKGMVNPWISVSNAAYDRMVRLACEMGVTPVSRTRVQKVRGSVKGAAANKFLKTG